MQTYKTVEKRWIDVRVCGSMLYAANNSNVLFVFPLLMSLLLLLQKQGAILLLDLVKLGADIAEEIPEFGRAKVGGLNGAVQLCHKLFQRGQLLLTDD